MSPDPCLHLQEQDNRTRQFVSAINPMWKICLTSTSNCTFLNGSLQQNCSLVYCPIITLGTFFHNGAFKDKIETPLREIFPALSCIPVKVKFSIEQCEWQWCAKELAFPPFFPPQARESCKRQWHKARSILFPSRLVTGHTLCPKRPLFQPMVFQAISFIQRPDAVTPLCQTTVGCWPEVRLKCQHGTRMKAL